MEVVLPSYEILTPFHTSEAGPNIHRRLEPHGLEMLKRIERAGRTCYKSEDKITEDSAIEFVRKVIKRGHHSVIEHESVSVRFVIDRGVSHELVRHRLAAYSQESTRYCDYNGGHVQFIKPLWTEIPLGVYKFHANNPFHSIIFGADESQLTTADCPMGDTVWIESMLYAERAYQILRKQGWKPQEARSVLPNSLKTEIVATYNLREWRHVFSLRTAHAAHPQIREVMKPLLSEMRQRIPVIFDDIGEIDETETDRRVGGN